MIYWGCVYKLIENSLHLVVDNCQMPLIFFYFAKIQEGMCVFLSNDVISMPGLWWLNRLKWVETFANNVGGRQPGGSGKGPVHPG